MSERGEVEFPEELRQQLFPNYPNEQQIDRFFATLGRAVSAWQLVETSLYLVYEAAIQPQAPGAAASAFHAIQTFNVKLSVTDAPFDLCYWGNQRYYQNGKPFATMRTQNPCNGTSSFISLLTSWSTLKTRTIKYAWSRNFMITAMRSQEKRRNTGSPTSPQRQNVFDCSAVTFGYSHGRFLKRLNKHPPNDNRIAGD
jgi:hypothetical protein